MATMNLMENGTVISDDLQIANIFNDRFRNIIPSLRIQIWNDNSAEASGDEK